MKKILLLFVLISQVAFSQTPRSRSYLQSHFQTGDKPTQTDYYDWMASSPNIVDDTISAGKWWGRKVSSAAPTNGQSYVWNSSTLNWELQTITGQVTLSGAQTISNKILTNATIDYNANTILNLPSSALPTTATLSGTSGTIPLAFTGNISYTKITQTGNITFSGSCTTEGAQVIATVDGDNIHSFTFPSNWVNGNGNIVDNTKRNRIYAQCASGEIIYNIVTSNLPDVVSPTFVSAVTTNANLVTVTFNKALAGTSNFTATGFTISSQTISGSTVQIVPSSSITQGQSLSISGGNTITNLTGTASFAGFSNQTITNNIGAVFSNAKSVLVNAAKTTAGTLLSGLDFSGSKPFSISFYVNVQDISTQYTIIQLTDSSVAALKITINTGSGFACQVTDGTNFILRYTSTLVSTSGWNNITIAYGGTTSSSDIDFYLNGTLVSSADYPGGSFTGIRSLTNSDQLIIGDGVNYLDEIAIFDIKLNSSQVSTIYNGGTVKDLSTLTFSSNLKAWYRFENNMLDLGSNHYDLTVGTPSYLTSHP